MDILKLGKNTFLECVSKATKKEMESISKKTNSFDHCFKHWRIQAEKNVENKKTCTSLIKNISEQCYLHRFYINNFKKFSQNNLHNYEILWLARYTEVIENMCDLFMQNISSENTLTIKNIAEIAHLMTTLNRLYLSIGVNEKFEWHVLKYFQPLDDVDLSICTDIHAVKMNEKYYNVKCIIKFIIKLFF